MECTLLIDTLAKDIWIYLGYSCTWYADVHPTSSTVVIGDGWGDAAVIQPATRGAVISGISLSG